MNGKKSRRHIVTVMILWLPRISLLEVAVVGWDQGTFECSVSLYESRLSVRKVVQEAANKRVWADKSCQNFSVLNANEMREKQTQNHIKVFARVEVTLIKILNV